MLKQRAIHYSEMLRLLDRAQQTGSTVNVKAWKSNGEIVEYNNWLVIGSHWRGGIHRLKNETSGQIRAVPDILIFEINNLEVYL